MCVSHPAMRCDGCGFSRLQDGVLLCVHNPPAVGRAGRARWPRVKPTDFCGRFRDTAPTPVINSDQSCRDAAPAPNHKLAIVNRKCEAGLPVFADSFGEYCKIGRAHV